MLSDRGHANDVHFLGKHFSVWYFFELLTPEVHRSYQNGAPKSVFWGERPLMEMFQNFAMKWFMQTMVQIFLPSFMETGKAEMTKPVRGIHYEKRLVYGPLPLGPLQWSCEKFYQISKDHIFP